MDIFVDLIHEVTSPSKEGSNPIGEKIVNKKVEQFTKVVCNTQKITIMSTIKQDDVRFVSRIIAVGICASSRIDELSARFIHASYNIVVEKEQVNLCDILQTQLIENLERLRRTKNNVFIFESLLCHIFFHVLRKFPFLSDYDMMNTDKCTMEKIIDVWKKHFEDIIIDRVNHIMTTFQSEMKARFRIAPKIIERFKGDIFIMVDTDRTYIEAVQLRETFVDPLEYEVSDNVAIFYIDLILKSGIDEAKCIHGRCEEITQLAYQESLEKSSKKKKKAILEIEEESHAVKSIS